MSRDEKIDTIEIVAKFLLNHNAEKAKAIINDEYPMRNDNSERNNFTDKEKFEQFKRDGFLDRYTGKKLINPGLLRTISFYFPDDFPYHPHWKMDSCHNAYWELLPTIDHIIPLALGGKNDKENYATTSMLNNSIKSNWTLEQLNWKLITVDKHDDWDGLTSLFVDLVNDNKYLLEEAYIKRWYNLAVSSL